MRTHLRPALVLLVLLTLLTGIAYPLAVAGVARLAFPGQAAGSLVRRDGRIVGSALIGQNFASRRYFHGRPSAAGKTGYDATASGGANLGPTSKALVDEVRGRVAALRAENPETATAPIPADLATASASGLDPHISPAAAAFQVPRVARARHMTEDRVAALVGQATEAPTLGLLGEPRVNVLRLNLSLDRVSAAQPGQGPP
jgi:K+-transporting ATPase ATPase C chain